MQCAMDMMSSQDDGAAESRSGKGWKGPDFLLLGAMKSGTTSLFHYICAHSRIIAPERKEIHFFDRMRYRGWTIEDYQAQFPETPPGMITGEATPGYLPHPHLARWLAEDFPEVRLLAILRNPVDRAYSHYNQRLVRGVETEDFLALAAVEDELSAPVWEKAAAEPDWEMRFEDGAGTFLSRGRYAEQIEQWRRYFPADRLHILFLADLVAAPQQAMDRIFAHLGLPGVPVDMSETHHARSYAPMPDRTRKWLAEYYRDHNRRLADLLDRELPTGWTC